MISTDVSSSEDDGAELLSTKLSNLKAIALVEDETRRQEKAKAKKRKRRHPRYDHLFGEYNRTKQHTRGYKKINTMYIRRYSSIKKLLTTL